MPSTTSRRPPRSDRSRPAGRSSPPRRVRLAAPEPTDPVEPASLHGGYGDGGFWALTRHADVTAVTRSPGWSVEANSAFVRPLDDVRPDG